MSNSNESATLSVEEAAKVLGIGRGAAYAAVRAGIIPALRVGPKLLRVSKASLAKLLDAESLESARAVQFPDDESSR